MSQSPEERNSVEALAEEFVLCYRRGERPPLDEYARDHPELADQIRDLFPALILLEEVGRQPHPEPDGKATAGGLPLEKLGDYRIVREAGRGGMGVVYEAVQEPLGRPVALKVLPCSAAQDSIRLQRFYREARTGARLHHTNIVPVFDVGEENGVHFYAMQFIRGRRLDHVIKEESGRRTDAAGRVPDPLPPSSHILHPSEVARIGAQVAEALAYAHAQTVVHRDIKPSNLLLDQDGTIWVTDFGLAKEEGDNLTRTGDIVGTLRYLAPEQFGGVCDARCDIYSLGLTLYELLTLRPAFEESDRVRLIRRVTQEEPPRPRQLDSRVPRDLETIVLKATAKEPARRYSSAAEMAEDLRRFLADRPILARRTSWREHAWRWARRNPGWAATLAITFVLLLITAAGGTALSLSLRAALADAQTAERDKTELSESLQGALADTRRAEQEKTDKLWQSLLDRARAERSSGRIGQRFKCLAAVREAAKIRVTPELRDEAVAALILPDLELMREWNDSSADTVALVPDAALVRYVRLNKQGELIVCRRGESGEEVLFRLSADGKPPYRGPWLSPDGRFLVCGHNGVNGSPAAVRVWRLDGPAPAVVVDAPAHQEGAIAFRPDGRHLALGYADGTFRVYDLATGGYSRLPPESPPPPLTVRALGQVPQRLAFHPSDGRLAAACGDQVRLFDVDAGRELPPLQQPEGITWTSGLAWHPDGRVLAASGNDSKLRLWNVETGAAARVWELPAGFGINLTFNRAGDRLLTADWSNTIRLWDANTGRRLLMLPAGFRLQFGPDDELLSYQPDSGKLQLWQLAGRELRTFRRRGAEPREVIHSPVAHPDGRVLAASSGPWLCFFDLERGAELASVRLPAVESAYPFSYSRGGWLTCGWAGLLLWPARPDPIRESGLLVGPPRRLDPPTPYLAFQAAGTDRDGRLIAVPRGGDALLLDRDRHGWHATLGPQNDVRRCAVSPDGRWIVTCTHWWDGRAYPVRVRDASTGRHVADLPLDGPHATAAFSPDGRFLATRTDDHGCRLWDVGTWRERRRFTSISHVFSPDSRLLALADAPGAIRLVEPGSGREVLRLTGTEAALYQPLAFSPDGTKFIAANHGFEALVAWDLRLIRIRLRELGLDWEGPEFPPARPTAPPPSVRIDPGVLRAPLLADDRLAVAVSDISLAFLPLNADAHYRRGRAYDQLVRPREAAADYTAFLALADPNDPRRIEVLSRRLKNYAEDLRDRPATLSAVLEMSKVPHDALPWPDKFATTCDDLARHFATTAPVEKWPDGNLAVAEKAAAIAPHNPAFQNTRGAVLYRLGRNQDVVRCLEENLKRPQKSAAFDHFYLAMAYQRLGRDAKAKTSFDAAADWPKTHTDLTDLQKAELATLHAEAAAALGLPAPPPPPIPEKFSPDRLRIQSSAPLPK